MLHWLWLGMTGGSLLYGCLTGSPGALLPAALEGVATAVRLSLKLLAGYLFFCGMMEIGRGIGLEEKMTALLKPFLRLLMPTLRQEEALRAASMNLTANLLGLGNAATPAGVEAVRLMDLRQAEEPRVRHALYMLLILNATGVQLLPTTVLTLRVAAGSAAPNSILAPTLACTALSTLVGAGLGLLCMRRSLRREAKR